MEFSEFAEFFNRFATVLSAATRHDLNNGGILRYLTLARQGSLCVAYAPFDHVARHARLVIVGITPGRVQAVNAIAAAAAALRAGKNHAEASRIAKLTGGFSGPMRTNLVSMLDHIGLASVLGVTSCLELFKSSTEDVHFSSALRYPVFVGEANYNGTPDMLRDPLLRSLIDTCLHSEVRRLHHAVWLPLGPQPTRVLSYLCDRGLLDRRNVLQGLPHPSGANSERIAYFVGRKGRAMLSAKTNWRSLDAARDELRSKIRLLSI